ncbi:MAG TPA: transcription antitermination factor NusB [Geobacteraceae bacterium]|nr:transcription antitermination factor NusB [Geobacteraceae bacterium]
MGVRREGRELALQLLYALEMNPVESGELMALSRDSSRSAEVVRLFAEELVAGVVANRDEIDRQIGEKSKNWSISRMAKVDLNILRMAFFELIFRNDIPKKVTINEAIEVAKKYGTEDSPAFINGMLDEMAAAIPDKE